MANTPITDRLAEIATKLNELSGTTDFGSDIHFAVTHKRTGRRFLPVTNPDYTAVLSLTTGRKRRGRAAYFTNDEAGYKKLIKYIASKETVEAKEEADRLERYNAAILRLAPFKGKLEAAGATLVTDNGQWGATYRLPNGLEAEVSPWGVKFYTNANNVEDLDAKLKAFKV